MCCHYTQCPLGITVKLPVALSEGALFIYFLDAFDLISLMSATLMIIIYDHKTLKKLCLMKRRYMWDKLHSVLPNDLHLISCKGVA